MKYPCAKLGKWVYDSFNYLIPTPGQEPVEYPLKTEFTIISQKDGFVFMDNPLQPSSNLDTMGVWRKNGSSKKDWEIYVVQDTNHTGYQIMSPTKKDKCGRIIELKGIFVESGFIPNTTQQPTVGKIKAYWISD